MRILILSSAAVLCGVLLGWAWTVAELGVRPLGDRRVEWGWPASAAPPALASAALAPKLIVEQGEFDFGKIELGGAGRHAFVFKNEGRGPLVLGKGESSCVCTLANIEHPDVPAGGSTTVEVEWHAKSRGQFRQSVQVLTNDPQRPRIELTIHGEVVSNYLLAPETIVFSGIAPQHSATAESRVYSFDADHLSIVDPQWADVAMAKFYELKIEPLKPDQLKEEKGAKSGCLLRVTVKPGLPAGRFGERIRFHLNSPDGPELELAIQGNIESSIEIWGPNWDSEHGLLTLGQVHSREGAKSVLYLTVRGDALKHADFRLAEASPNTLKVTVGKMEKLGAEIGRIPLTIEIPPGTPPEDHLGTQIAPLARVLLDTGLLDNKQMRIFVRYAVED